MLTRCAKPACCWQTKVNLRFVGKPVRLPRTLANLLLGGPHHLLPDIVLEFHPEREISPRNPNQFRVVLGMPDLSRTPDC
jgi:hypothetical protein